MKAFCVGIAKQTGVLVLLGFLLASLLAPAPGEVQADDGANGVWVLTETLVNPSNAKTEFVGGGSMPDYFGEARFEGKFLKYSASETGFGIEDREVDHGYEYHHVTVQASLQAPPAELIPGEVVELAVTFSHSGSVNEGGIGIAIQFWYSAKGINMQPAEVTWYAPWAPTFDGRSSATYQFDVPPATSGGEIEIYASLWNSAPCLVVWKYEARPPAEAEPSPEVEEEEEEELPEEDKPRKPVIILPGIYGSYVNSIWSEGSWLYSRGLAPETLMLDPLAHFYDDIVATLKNAGYVQGEDLFLGAYDWRMPPGPFDGSYDGVIGGMSGTSITDERYEYGVDYLGYYLKQAAERWRQKHDGEILDSVDIISHSTGGLVARVYIQGLAYGQHYRAPDGTPVPLPRVDNLIMVAVPNRGAALPWQAMHNNFKRDFASKYVMSKILARSYYKVQRGATIDGPAAPITPDSVRDPATGAIDPVKFINLYCPTFRSLLATYPFLIKPDGSLVGVNGLPEVRNDLVLDLNNGLDLPDRPAPADASPFANAVNHTTVFYANAEETAHQMRERTDAAANAVFGMDDKFEQDVAEGTTWYEDVAARVGDGTVPAVSSMGQFLDDGRIDVVQVSSGDTSHTGLMANRAVQSNILRILGVDAQDVEISTGLAWSSPYAVLLVTDPVGALMVDGEGRRLGWTPETGPLNEMPNSMWFGEGDGIGVVYGELVQPLRVDLVGLGDDHHIVQVVGDQPGQRIGIEDDKPLALGETRSVEVEVRAGWSVPAQASGEGAASGSHSGRVLLIVGAAVVGVAGLGLVVLAVTRARRRRRA